MNGFDDYDVDDDLPLNIPDNSKENVANTTRFVSKKQQKELVQDPSKTARKPRPKLDFNRLLRGSRGLGYLAVTAKKHLKLSGGPGTEAQDLSQICVYLQEWAKLVFPKMNLADFLMKSEEICQSRLMKDCVPKLLSRLKEMGDDANLADLATVESEILTRMATEEAEKALQSINAGLDQTQRDSATAATEEDFDIEAALAEYGLSSKKRRERSEILKDEDDSEGSEDNEEEYSKEMADFINDNDNDSGEASESENEAKEKLKSTRGRGISFNFQSSESEPESESESETEHELSEPHIESNEDNNSISFNNIDDDVTQKKRSARVIMSDEE